MIHAGDKYMRVKAEQTRVAIINAARQHFLELGYAGTTIDIIANTAGITKQTVYSYFKDKRSIFTAVIDTIVGTPRVLEVNNYAAGSSREVRAALFLIGSHINSVITEPAYIQLLRVIIAETITEPDIGQLFRRGITAESLIQLTALFTHAKTNNIVKTKNPEALARMFLGGFVTRIFLDGLLMQSGRKVIGRQTSNVLNAYIDEFMRIINSPK
jgi:TetR/AcrR family transcriptional repressor of mexJK operon